MPITVPNVKCNQREHMPSSRQRVFKEKGTIYAKSRGGKELGWSQKLKGQQVEALWVERRECDEIGETRKRQSVHARGHIQFLTVGSRALSWQIYWGQVWEQSPEKYI